MNLLNTFLGLIIAFLPLQLYSQTTSSTKNKLVYYQSAKDHKKRTIDDSVGLASYPMDSHFCSRSAVEINGVKTVRNEGGFGAKLPKPFPISLL